MEAYINEGEEDIFYIAKDKPEWSALELKEIPDDLYERYIRCNKEFFEIQRELEQYCG